MRKAGEKRFTIAIRTQYDKVDCTVSKCNSHWIAPRDGLGWWWSLGGKKRFTDQRIFIYQIRFLKI